ncbi:hypothetical protein Tco_0330966 [Tanacetum coccineum]
MFSQESNEVGYQSIPQVTYNEVNLFRSEDLSDMRLSGSRWTAMMSEDPNEFIPPEDEVFPAEEQPLPAVVSPTTDSPGYIADSNPDEDEVDPEEDLEEDPKEDPTDYPTDGGDDDD